MKQVLIIIGILIMMGCSSNDESWLSIENSTDMDIFAIPYTEEFSHGTAIPSGEKDEFFTLSCDCLDGYTYFSTYYDSLVIFFNNEEETPVKFYSDGRTINYDSIQNPFINPLVWNYRVFEEEYYTEINSVETRMIYEHFFTIKNEIIDSYRNPDQDVQQDNS